MFGNLGNRFVFPAPQPSYGQQSYKRNLCWIPWNSVISPKRVNDEENGGIPCLWFPAPKAATVILFFHANAEDLGMSFAVLRHIRDQFKVNVLAVEYPGYGLLHGMEPTEDAVYEVALTAFRFLVDEIGVRYSQIILFGRSLGSGPAVFLAAQYPVGGLILVSAFASIKAAVQSIVGRMVAWTFTERFPNSRIIANVSCSTLFIHGEADSLIPPEHSLKLFKRCRARKLLVTPPKMEHNSNLFGDAAFLAVPAIHFFGFPGYYTGSPPRLPAYLFEDPAQRARMLQDRKEPKAVSLTRPSWFCDCLAKGDAQPVDVTFCRQENSVEDITIRFKESDESHLEANLPMEDRIVDDMWRYRTEHVGSMEENRELCALRAKAFHVFGKEGGWINQPIGPKPMSARVSKNNDRWNNTLVRDPLDMEPFCYPLNREQLTRHIKKVRARQQGMPEEDPEFQITDLKYKNFHGQTAQR